MSVGEVISALCLYAADWDGDQLLMLKDIYGIEASNDRIEILFTDGNTPDVVIDKSGKDIGT